MSVYNVELTGEELKALKGLFTRNLHIWKKQLPTLASASEKILTQIDSTDTAHDLQETVNREL